MGGCLMMESFYVPTAAATYGSAKKIEFRYFDFNLYVGYYCLRDYLVNIIGDGHLFLTLELRT